MKRRRRPFTAWKFQIVQAMAYGGPVIPPSSVVRCTGDAAEIYGGNSFRIGYYGRQDGLNCVWFVDANGKYIGTGDQRYVRENFEIVELSDETDLYGDAKPPLPSLTSAH